MLKIVTEKWVNFLLLLPSRTLVDGRPRLRGSPFWSNVAVLDDSGCLLEAGFGGRPRPPVLATTSSSSDSLTAAVAADADDDATFVGLFRFGDEVSSYDESLSFDSVSSLGF